MKIIKEGQIPEVKEWWWGLKMTCGTCHAEVELEKGDNPHITIERRPNGKRELHVKCPTPTCMMNIVHQDRNS